MRLPSLPEDFRVDEIPLYEASGRGAHTFLQVRKRGRTTEDVARDLARAVGLRPAEVGYAGRKDRNAVTTQWFSVPGLDPLRALELELPGATVLAASRHAHKLRTGHLRGNAFRIVVREVSEADWQQARERLEVLMTRGMPNRFGAQRFGRDGANPERAAALFAGAAAPRDRRHARFLVSALQAQVFNAVLAARDAPLDGLERGDVAVLHESGGLFVVEDPEAERSRLGAFALSATGPIFGTRTLTPRYAVAEREARICAAHGVPVPLRVRPEDVSLERDGDALALRFRLPRGSYATVLLEEVFAAPDDTRGAIAVC